MRTVIGLCAALGAAVARSTPPTSATAQDAELARIVKPSVEELAGPLGGLPKPAGNARESDAREAMCLMIESAARANELPLEFFARVIWQESRFQSDAVGPVTRNGQRAQGID